VWLSWDRDIAGSVRRAVPGACYVTLDMLAMPGRAKESRWLLVGDEVAPSSSSIKGASKADSA
jgi:hypothetical protein